ncbi:hypothetical protein ABKA04_004431 [Annulohypoxylon sp. FPYF3050]
MIRRVQWQLSPPRGGFDAFWYAALPGGVAELEFPKGLRVGELWDLATSHPGMVQVIWPSVDAPADRQLSTQANYQWDYDQIAEADESMTLIVRLTCDQGLEGKILDTLRGHSPLRSFSVLRSSPPNSAVRWTFISVSDEELATMSTIFQRP